MRLDKFLKVSRLIKRRTVAKEASDGARVKVNGKTSKPACDVKEGDVIEITFGNKTVSVEVVSVAETGVSDIKPAEKKAKAATRITASVLVFSVFLIFSLLKNFPIKFRNMFVFVKECGV